MTVLDKSETDSEKRPSPEPTMGLWARLKTLAYRLRLDVLTVYCAARESRTPWLVRLLALSIAAYALSPIDLIPDFIPVLGYLDELILLPLAIGLVLRLTPQQVIDDARKRARELTGRPSSRGGALFVVLVWALCVSVLIRWI